MLLVNLVTGIGLILLTPLVQFLYFTDGHTGLFGQVLVAQLSPGLNGDEACHWISSFLLLNHLLSLMNSPHFTTVYIIEQPCTPPSANTTGVERYRGSKLYTVVATATI